MKNGIKIFAGTLLALATVIPAFADSVDLPLQGETMAVLQLSIVDDDGSAAPPELGPDEGSTSVLDFAQVDYTGTNPASGGTIGGSSAVDGVRLVDTTNNIYANGGTAPSATHAGALYIMGTNNAVGGFGLKLTGSGAGVTSATVSAVYTNTGTVPINVAPPNAILSLRNKDWSAGLYTAGAVEFAAPSAPQILFGTGGSFGPQLTSSVIQYLDLAVFVKPTSPIGTWQSNFNFQAVP